MMKVNYGLKVDMGPSGQNIVSVQKNGFPMSIHVTDIKTAAAVVNLLQQEYMAGFCDGEDDHRKNTVMREPTEAEVDTFLNMRGLTKVTIASASMPNCALDTFAFDDTEEELDDAITPDIRPEDLIDCIDDALEVRVRDYFRKTLDASETDMWMDILRGGKVSYENRETLANSLNEHKRLTEENNKEYYTVGDIIKEQVEEQERNRKVEENVANNSDLPPMTGDHCGGKPECNDYGNVGGNVEADPFKHDAGIDKPCEEYYTTDDSFLKDIVPPVKQKLEVRTIVESLVPAFIKMGYRTVGSAYLNGKHGMIGLRVQDMVKDGCGGDCSKCTNCKE